MRRIIGSIGCVGVLSVPTVLSSPAAVAQDLVTYEIVSDDIAVTNLEYQDSAGRALLENVALPWRADVMVDAVRGAPPGGSQVRADWRPSARPNRWVTVRIIYQGEVICESTLDIGNATCYGIVPRVG